MFVWVQCVQSVFPYFIWKAQQSAHIHRQETTHRTDLYIFVCMFMWIDPLYIHHWPDLKLFASLSLPHTVLRSNHAWYMLYQRKCIQHERKYTTIIIFYSLFSMWLLPSRSFARAHSRRLCRSKCARLFSRALMLVYRELWIGMRYRKTVCKREWNR